MLLIQYGLQYGPTAVADIIAIINKGSAATVSDVQNAFANLKPYNAYGIQDVEPAEKPIISN